ncbi:sensor histidine kinase [Paludibacter sp. 221]|uniref:sensor histidine kinase n=1 Tax=Paludibacter sp. 221 TaxID=2302939 RepID=UPI0013D7E54B|nr:HAMP domain-containing sensor histidine kinase [Paludibacter sp. 221]NDV47386.1 sensor histidine kinase [Paludibacter sp. 221]
MKKNNLYAVSQRLKLIFIAIAVLIVSASTFFTNRLAKSLAEEEQKKIEIWAEATHFLSMSNIDDNMVNELVLKIIKGNTTIPVIVGYKDKIIEVRNVKTPSEEKEDEYYAKCVERFKEKHEPIVLQVIDEKMYVYYDDSSLLKQLYYFPYVQLGIILIFILIALFAFGSTKKAEQNQVWVGLSKETAHQLGTPISSLLAWSELLKSKYPDDNLLNEMEKDVNRLRIIAERFSKIGSIPDMQSVDLKEVLKNAVQYVSNRSSKKVSMQCHFQNNVPLYVELNVPLFEWVIENLCKNAIDAMDGEGNVDIYVETKDNDLFIDIKDTGKGLEKRQFKAIFTPGYTTKKRGWGLGLSLAKRIVEEYHCGKIFVKQSEINVGTTIRLSLKLKGCK